MTLHSWFPKWHVVVGYAAMTIGVVPLALWVANYLDIVRPHEKPGFALELFVSAGMIGLGWMAATEQGSKIWYFVLEKFNLGGTPPE